MLPAAAARGNAAAARLSRVRRPSRTAQGAVDQLAVVVSVNLVVWGLVSATTAQLIYPWPLWVAGPWGAVLLAVSVSVTQARRGGDHRTLPGPSNTCNDRTQPGQRKPNSMT